MTPTNKLDTTLHELGIEPADLVRLTGKNRVQVWRWRTGPDDAVPDFVWTIINQQKRIRALTAQLVHSAPAPGP